MPLCVSAFVLCMSAELLTDLPPEICHDCERIHHSLAEGRGAGGGRVEGGREEKQRHSFHLSTAIGHQKWETAVTQKCSNFI